MLQHRACLPLYSLPKKHLILVPAMKYICAMDQAYDLLKALNGLSTKRDYGVIYPHMYLNPSKNNSSPVGACFQSAIFVYIHVYSFSFRYRGKALKICIQIPEVFLKYLCTLIIQSAYNDFNLLLLSVRPNSAKVPGVELNRIFFVGHHQ